MSAWQTQPFSVKSRGRAGGFVRKIPKLLAWLLNMQDACQLWTNENDSRLENNVHPPRPPPSVRQPHTSKAIWQTQALFELFCNYFRYIECNGLRLSINVLLWGFINWSKIMLHLKSSEIATRRAALKGHRFSVLFYGAWFVIDEHGFRTTRAANCTQAIQIAEQRNITEGVWKWSW